MDTSVPLLWGKGRGYTRGYEVERCVGLESIIHSNLFLQTPDLCISALGVGESVLRGGGGGIEQVGVKDFGGLKFTHNFTIFEIRNLFSQLRIVWVQF